MNPTPSLKNIKLIIFDLDGVIVSTDQLHFQAWQEITRNEGIYFDYLINNRLKGLSRKDCLDIILENSKKTYSENEKQFLLHLKNQKYLKLLESLSDKDLSPHIREVLIYLKNKGYKLGIGSSSKNAKLILNKLYLIEYFDVISDGTNISNGKPNPEVFLYASQTLNITPKDCAVVEDGISGIIAANTANMISIGFKEASTYPESDYKLNTLLDLKNLF